MPTRVATKKPTAKNTAPAKRPVGRPRKTENISLPEVVEEKVTSKKTVKAKPGPKTSPAKEPVVYGNPNLFDSEADKNKKIQGVTYAKVAEILGVGISTEQFLVAIELMKGGNTRNEINERVKELLPTHTQNGTPKQVTNLVSGVHNRMLEAGFVLKGTYQLLKPPVAK